MSMITDPRNPNPNIAPIPVEMRATVNFLGFPGMIAPRTDETRQIINVARITENLFPEAMIGTRFNAELFNAIDTTILKITTYKVEKLIVTNMTTEGTETQFVVITPNKC
ncbi:hypothetical protein PGB90_001739 [Kerria lacca]